MQKMCSSGRCAAGGGTGLVEQYVWDDTGTLVRDGVWMFGCGDVAPRLEIAVWRQISEESSRTEKEVRKVVVVVGWCIWAIGHIELSWILR